MITAILEKGKRCEISPDAYIGYQEHGGMIFLGDGVRIAHGCVIRTCTGIIRIGDLVSIGYYCVLHGMGGITIGEYTLISPGVHIYAQNHGISIDTWIRNQANIPQPIFIGEDCWIGANSVILGGSVISNGCVIGAGSVFKGETGPDEIWAGNIAKKIGERE